MTFQKEGPYTLSSLYFAHDVLASGEGYYETRIGAMRHYEPEPSDTTLLVVFPRQDGCWQGVEDVQRYYRDEVMLHQSTSGLGLPNQSRLLYSVLIPRTGSTDPASIASSVGIADSDHGAGLKFDLGQEQITVGVQVELDRRLLWEDIRPRYS